MPLTCNIDSRGKRARLIYGLLMLALGVALLLAWAIPYGHWWRWTIAIACLAAGAFALFEARSGWCIVRALGIKTPM